MNVPFTKEEITKAITSMKNNKSPGIDNINAEHLKNAPDIDLLTAFIVELSNILNDAAETGNAPKEITQGLDLDLLYLSPYRSQKKVGQPEIIFVDSFFTLVKRTKLSKIKNESRKTKFRLNFQIFCIRKKFIGKVHFVLAVQSCHFCH